jgi:hypothetical protein
MSKVASTRMDELLSPELMEDPCESIVARTEPFIYNRKDIIRKSSLVLSNAITTYRPDD